MTKPLDWQRYELYFRSTDQNIKCPPCLVSTLCLSTSFSLFLRLGVSLWPKSWPILLSIMPFSLSQWKRLPGLFHCSYENLKKGLWPAQPGLGSGFCSPEGTVERLGRVVRKRCSGGDLYGVGVGGGTRKVRVEQTTACPLSITSPSCHVGQALKGTSCQRSQLPWSSKASTL